MKAFLQTLLVAFTLCLGSTAFAQCRIVIQQCKALGITSSISFIDNHVTSNEHPNHCLQRSRDYMDICNSSEEVGAEFYVNGVMTIASYVTPNTSYLWTRAANGQWIFIPRKY